MNELSLARSMFKVKGLLKVKIGFDICNPKLTHACLLPIISYTHKLPYLIIYIFLVQHPEMMVYNMSSGHLLYPLKTKIIIIPSFKRKYHVNKIFACLRNINSNTLIHPGKLLSLISKSQASANLSFGKPFFLHKPSAARP